MVISLVVDKLTSTVNEVHDSGDARSVAYEDDVLGIRQPGQKTFRIEGIETTGCLQDIVVPQVDHDRLCVFRSAFGRL